MRIEISREAYIKLTAWTIATGRSEFSGRGIVERRDYGFEIMDVFLMAVGSEVFTVIPSEKLIQMTPDPRNKLWFHRHPIGNGVPGPHNWSGTDNRTIETEPLGGTPELVQWSLSIVFTPQGWVGRADIYLPRLKTYHLPVVPGFPTPEDIEEARKLVDGNMQSLIDGLYNEYLISRSESMKEAFEELEDDIDLDDDMDMDEYMYMYEVDDFDDSDDIDLELEED